MLKSFYRRNLPHLQRDYKPHFLTFCTWQRWMLPDAARSLVLECCLRDHGVKIDLQVAVVMPDHVHMVFVPLVDEVAREIFSLAEITQGIKGASAHKINRLLGRSGAVWQDESFDRVLRSTEKLDEKLRYVAENPVRKGLVGCALEYRWLWVK